MQSLTNDNLPADQQDIDELYDYEYGDWEKSDTVCPKCGSTDTVEAEFPDGLDDTKTVWECNNCGYRMEE
jgi:ribosomal protein S27AE